VLTLVNTLITALNNESGGGNYSNAELRSLQSQLTQTRDGLLSNKNGQQGALTQINNARDQVAQATISGTNSELSSAQAQIDQARASLRSAESRLANTYLRAPIAGTVDALDLTLGQFIPGGTTIAEITNQNALEITTYVSTNERERIQTGNEVKIGTEYTGTITSIAPAADRASGKIRVTISTSEATFTIGSTVEVTFETQGSETSTTIKDTPLQIPITAIRFTGKETAVLQVDTEGVLYATPVILGDTVGNTINVVSGISSSTLLVRDVRGKQAGDMVTVESN
jgi:RND family efflux transporter MFP subunit